MPADFSNKLRASEKLSRTFLLPLALRSPAYTPLDFAAWLESLPGSEICQFSLEFTGKITPISLRAIENWQASFCQPLRVWYQVYFSKVEQDIISKLSQEISRQPQDISPPELVRQLSNGIRLDNMPEINHVYLIPQYHYRPWNLYEVGKTILILLYPCRLDPIQGETPPDLLRLTKALADENRLRLLRLLAQSPHTFTEIAGKMGIAKSTVHHHLVSLRAAGLVWVYLSAGRNERISLRLEAVEGFQEQLIQYLKGKAK